MGDKGIKGSKGEVKKDSGCDVYEFTARPFCESTKFCQQLLFGLNKPDRVIVKDGKISYGGSCPVCTELPRVPRAWYIDDYGFGHVQVDRLINEIIYEELYRFDVELDSDADKDNRAYPTIDNPHGWSTECATDDLLEILFDKKIRRYIEGGTDLHFPFDKKQFIEEINVIDEKGDEIEMQEGSEIIYSDGTTDDMSGNLHFSAEHKGIKLVHIVVPEGSHVAEVIMVKPIKTIAEVIAVLDTDEISSDTSEIDEADRENLKALLSASKLLAEEPATRNLGLLTYTEIAGPPVQRALDVQVKNIEAKPVNVEELGELVEDDIVSIHETIPGEPPTERDLTPAEIHTLFDKHLNTGYVAMPGTGTEWLITIKKPFRLKELECLDADGFGQELVYTWNTPSALGPIEKTGVVVVVDDEVSTEISLVNLAEGDINIYEIMFKKFFDQRMFGQEFTLAPPTSGVANAVGQQVLAANPERKYAIIVNDGAGVVYLGLGANPAVGSGIRLNGQGSSYEITNINMYKGNIYARRGAAPDKNLTITEGT